MEGPSRQETKTTTYTYSSGNCATTHGGGGGWWFGNCHLSNLNGLNAKQEKVGGQLVVWHGFTGSSLKSLKSASMSIRPMNAN